MKKILVSACLLGAACRYDGKEKLSKETLDLKDEYTLIPVCPEIMGGLPTPREPSEIQGERVVTEKGQDNSKKFNLGAQESLKLAELLDIDTAILKSRSPSCGSRQVYDGSFSGVLINGQGVTTKLLRENGIKVYSEKEILEFRKEEEGRKMTSLELERKSIWKQIDKKTYDEIFDFGEDYKEFLDNAKTERDATRYMEKLALEKGFVPFDQAIKSEIKAGDKIFLNNKNKSCVLFVMGENIEEGMNILAAHLDSPRLDIKQNPLYEDGETALLKTHYYGGVKKYQWPTIALALHGVIINSKGEKFDIKIGDNEGDPVFFVNDLLAHLSADLNKKTLGAGIEGEKLNLVIGHSDFGMEDEENPIKKAILHHLHKEYGMIEEDFLVSELNAVPAQNAVDVGFDRSMIAAYGHDDKVCSFSAFEAILDIEKPKTTAVGIFVDKEEIGSVGNTTMTSAFFTNALAEIIASQGQYSELKLRRALKNSKIISADVAPAVDPNHPEVMDLKNSARLGHGVTIVKYGGSRGKGGSSDANAEFLAYVRDIFNSNKVVWQTGTYGKVDQGGGGTIAGFLAEYGAEVLDVGTAMLSMHAPVELVSKADVYMTYKAYKAFIEA